MAQEEGLALTPLWEAPRAPSRDVSEAGHLRGHRELAESPREAGGLGRRKASVAGPVEVVTPDHAGS